MLWRLEARPSLKAKATSPKATPDKGQKHFLSLTSPESGRTAETETSKTVQIPLDCHPPAHLPPTHLKSGLETN